MRWAYRGVRSSTTSAGSARVARRAARCDGTGDRQLSADEVAGVLDAVRGAGLPADRLFDVAVRGNASPALPERLPPVDFKDLAEAGMTWWMESLIHVGTLELSMQVVDAGPPRP